MNGFIRIDTGVEFDRDFPWNNQISCVRLLKFSSREHPSNFHIKIYTQSHKLYLIAEARQNRRHFTEDRSLLTNYHESQDFINLSVKGIFERNYFRDRWRLSNQSFSGKIYWVNPQEQTGPRGKLVYFAEKRLIGQTRANVGLSNPNSLGTQAQVKI